MMSAHSEDSEYWPIVFAVFLVLFWGGVMISCSRRRMRDDGVVGGFLNYYM